MRYSNALYYGVGMNPDLKYELIQEDVLKFIKDYDYVSLSELKNKFENTTGNMWFGLRDTNIWYDVGLSNELIDIIIDLMNKKQIYMTSANWLTLFADGAFLSWPIAKRLKYYKKPRWLPILLRPQSKWDEDKRKNKKISFSEHPYIHPTQEKESDDSANTEKPNKENSQ